MDNIPPSYEIAVARNPWRIIAQYIPSTDLCALNRVNKNLNDVFAPYLWGNPASHFGTENDRVYVALTRFKRTLKRVRRSVRELTHTLHLPPAQSEIYDGPHSEWLRDVLEQLPNLQSLVVSQLPFFDHMALLALRLHGERRRNTRDESPKFSLKLLIAVRCKNATSQGLAKALEQFPHLAFLDLSNTQAARDKNVLSRLGGLPLLQILKLRSINLKDEDVVILAEAIGVRVRSLDVEGNHLTDHSVRTLLQSCFQAEDAAHGSSNGTLHTASNLAVEDWPSGFARPDPAVLDEFKDESYDERFVRRLTSGTISRLPYEDLPPSGITHLYIANNKMTVEGLASLIRSRKLHVLDAGSLRHGTILNRPRSPSSTSTPHPHDDNRPVRIPGEEKLIPLLSEFGKEMTSLRLHHAIITEDAPTKIDRSLGKVELSAEGATPPELEQTAHAVSAELDAAAHEMDAMPPLYELESNAPVPRFELPGDSTHVVISPPIGDKPTSTKKESRHKIKRGSVYAPELVEQRESNDDVPPILSATGFDTAAHSVNLTTAPSAFMGKDECAAEFGTMNRNVTMVTESTREQSQNLLQKRLKRPHGLIPGMMPKLRSLTLTDIPIHARSPRVHEALINFIKDCASETELAIYRAGLRPSEIRQPGQRQQPSLSLSDDQRAFALRQIILEVSPASSSLSPQSAQKSSFSRNTKSSTEDADSEALWSAAENDFTFFDDDEECGLPSIDTDSPIPYSVISEKIIMPTDNLPDHQLPTLQHPSQKETLIDVIQELSRFRKERKAAYEDAVKRGVHFMDGYWPGEVKVVRGHHHAGGKVDYYGNIFEKGIYR